MINKNKPEISISDTVEVAFPCYNMMGRQGVVTGVDEDQGYFKVEFETGEEYSYSELDLDLVKKGDCVSSENPIKTSSKTLQNSSGGIKHDRGKLRYTLLLQDLPRAVKEVTEVLEFGAKKYQRMNFEKVESHRYDEAMCRHLMAYLSGEITDPESGKHHLSHLVCCAMFLIEREVVKGEDHGYI